MAPSPSSARRTSKRSSPSISRQAVSLYKLKRTLLVIDDDRIFCSAVSDYLSSDTLEVITVHTAAACFEICSLKKIDIALLDQRLPDQEGHTLCPGILSHNEQTKIIFTTAYPSIDHAVNAIRAGAYDYLSKPFELEELDLSISRALRTLALENIEQLQHYRNNKEVGEHTFIGSNGGLAEVDRMLNLAAATEAPVLITGETGTGKNVAAKAIHYRGMGNAAPFVSINCAALPETLIEAELFGHEKGAFTGAASAKKGVFEMAEGGTLFLDEIGEMPVHLQSKLLGVLDDKNIRRLGGDSVRAVAVRIIAATSVDLEEAIRQKQFRGDLYYRLSVIKIHMPPLRERRGDIPLLCDYLVGKYAKKKTVELPSDEYEKLMSYDWPGNVRELRNIIERASILQQGQEMRPSVLISFRQRPNKDTNSLSSCAAPAAHAAAAPLRLDELEKQQIGTALEQFSWNYTKAAQALGISLSTLKRKIKSYGIAPSN
ncbi:MAG: DNA-binding response regulator [Thermodesulfovibrio sp.]|nr:DNA-binding response regulator [Thermodesulfovibrio sp.]